MTLFKDDMRDGFLVAVTVAAGVLPFAMALGVSWWFIFVYVVLSNVHLNASMHYQIHRPMFSSPRVNRAYELLCVVPCLVGFQEYKYIHITHHKNANDKQKNGKVFDPVSTYRWGADGKEEPLLSYIFFGPFRNVLMGETLNAPTQAMDVSKYYVELYVKFGIAIGIAILNIKFFPFYLLMLYLTWAFNWALSYCEHHNALDQEDVRKDSVSCYNRVYNFFLFNTGYHQEHHYRPGTHWLQLPKLTKQLPLDRVVTRYTLFDNH